MTLNLSILVQVLVPFFSCSLAGTLKQDTKPAVDRSLSSLDNLQSWDDWLTKRGLTDDHWGFQEHQPGKLQNWQEWLQKRGLFRNPMGLEHFGLGEKPHFQDWLAKRGAESLSPYTGFTDSDHSRFQQWSDWISKRYMDMGAGVSELGLNAKPDLQNWSDFVKRQSLSDPNLNWGFTHNGQYQSWQDWVKRFGPSQGLYKLGDKDRFEKRQQDLNPDRYFTGMFTAGLQDWRSSFHGNKRDKSQAKNVGQDKPVA